MTAWRLEKHEHQIAILPVFNNTSLELLRQAFLIEVEGAAEIEDYSRLSLFLERYNEIAEAVAYSAIIGEFPQEAVRETERSIAEIEDKNKKAKASERMTRLAYEKNLARQRAREQNLFQDPQNLSNLKMFIDLFNSGAFDITIIPKDGSANVVFRAVVDKQSLRIEPYLVRSLYGGFVESSWTMVGQVTYLPGVQLPPPVKGNATRDMDDESPSMRDPYKEMFRSTQVFERMFLESKNRVEVVTCPLLEEFLLILLHSIQEKSQTTNRLLRCLRPSDQTSCRQHSRQHFISRL